MNAARRFASNNLSSFQSAREREEDEVPYAHRPVRSKIENRKHTHEKIEKQKNAENASLFLFWKASRRAKRERERKRKRKKPLWPYLKKKEKEQNCQLSPLRPRGKFCVSRNQRFRLRTHRLAIPLPRFLRSRRRRSYTVRRVSHLTPIAMRIAGGR